MADAENPRFRYWGNQHGHGFTVDRETYIQILRAASHDGRGDDPDGWFVDVVLTPYCERVLNSRPGTGTGQQKQENEHEHP